MSRTCCLLYCWILCFYIFYVITQNINTDECHKNTNLHLESDTKHGLSAGVSVRGAEFSESSDPPPLYGSVYCAERPPSPSPHKQGSATNAPLLQQLLTHRSPRVRASDENEERGLIL